MEENEIRASLERHWAASEAGDFEREHEIYDEDAVLEYPQSGERIRGRAGIRATRSLHPSDRHFRIRRMLGSAALWVTEYVITYDGAPSFTVSVMEFRDGKVMRETQYFGDPFPAAAWRTDWADPPLDRETTRDRPVS
jgi:ketosteroid isomerase-like protein